MTFADVISQRTENYGPAIERHCDGAITFHWPIRTPRGATLTITRISDLTGLDDDLFYKSLMRGEITLHIPGELASSNV